MANKSVVATIAAGQSLSAAINIDGRPVLGLLAPAMTTGGPMTFQVSQNGITFAELTDDQGNTIATGQMVGSTQFFSFLNDNIFNGINYIKIRSGTAAAPVTQSGSAGISVILAS